jgi:hypothetical protein
VPRSRIVFVLRRTIKIVRWLKQVPKHASCSSLDQLAKRHERFQLLAYPSERCARRIVSLEGH